MFNHIRRGDFSGKYLFSLFTLVLLNCVIGIFAFIEVIAPHVMNLPFHHCLYCLVQKTLDAPVFVALFVLGNSMIAALFPVWLLSKEWAEKRTLTTLLCQLLLIGTLCLGGSLLMITTHLL